jgi:hypothetical protein
MRETSGSGADRLGHPQHRTGSTCADAGRAIGKRAPGSGWSGSELLGSQRSRAAVQGGEALTPVASTWLGDQFDDYLIGRWNDSSETDD